MTAQKTGTGLRDTDAEPTPLDSPPVAAGRSDTNGGENHNVTRALPCVRTRTPEYR